MANSPLTQKESSQPTLSRPSKDIHQTLTQKQSAELVIAVCGPIGCGTNEISGILEKQLSDQGYAVEIIRVSSLMTNKIQQDANLADLIKFLPDSGTQDQFERYEKLQTTGNSIRQRLSTSVLAKLAIEDISVRREELETKEKEAGATNTKPASERRIAYIIDQLKHPNEAMLLRKVYGSLFYMVGILSKKNDRLLKLRRDQSINNENANRLIERDKEEDLKYGQKLEKTLQLADYFIRNLSDNTQALNAAAIRFINLIHGKNGITPTKDESGMYAAFSASLESACLSRQVGAAICNEQGYILATGKNDVPRAGGGLYREHHENDLRCIHKGAKCYNDEYKNKLKVAIERILSGSDKVDDKNVKKLAEDIAQNTPINALIEYSRSIHAEMDAIISLSRNPGASTEGTFLYTTTYPCHNCARHIVAAGINRVVYIQPYEKSLAEELHEDAITSSGEANKVSFEPFEGVAPRRYQLFFLSISERKLDGGKAVDINVREMKNKDEEFIDSYLYREKGVVKHLNLEIHQNTVANVIQTDLEE